MGKDLWVPVKAPPETLARMAQVVGVTPEQLETAGRPDAAAELRELPALAEPERPLTLDEIRADLARLNRESERQRAENAELRRQLQQVLQERKEEREAAEKQHDQRDAG